MDRSLREMGVGDLSVGKKVRRMAEVFYGRAQVYAPPLHAEDAPALRQALYRNIFAGIGPEEGAGRISAYALRVRRHLHECPTGAILSGELGFPDP